MVGVERAAWLVFLIFLVPPTAAADWLQEGHDAARTGRAESGPRWDDVAFIANFTHVGTADDAGSLVIVNRTVYATHVVPGSACFIGTQGKMPHALYAMSVDDGRLVALAPFAMSQCYRTPGLASDGDSIFVSTDEELLAFGPDGALRHRTAFLPLPAAATLRTQTPALDCSHLAVEGGKVYVACGTLASRVGSTPGAIALWAYDAKTLALVAGPWTPSTQLAKDVSANPVGVLGLGDEGGLVPLGLAVADGLAVVTARSGPKGDDAWGQGCIRPVDGFDVWAFNVTAAQPAGQEEWHFNTWLGPGCSLTGAPILRPAPVLIGGQRVFMRQGRVISCPVHACGQNSPHAVSDAMTESTDVGTAMAASADGVVVGAGQQAFRLSADLRRMWRTELPDGQYWDEGGLLLAGDLVVGPVTPAPGGSRGLVALNATTGDVVWSHDFGNNGPLRLAASDGLLAVRDDDGLRVLGTTPASLRPIAQIGTRFPRPGEAVRVELSRSGAGLQGAPTAFMAVWGDGGQSPWQPSTLLTHTYASAKDHAARVFVRNDAGQTASIPVTFHVGQHDPAVNILNTPFADEYQQTTFFVLGLLATAAAALFGILRAGRKRRRLHAELQDLESDFKRLESDAHACDAMLAERKARARSLFLEKRLEEAHASFLVGRVDELRRGLRLGAVDAKLKFLPHGMVLRLQKVLADARIDEYEREHFLSALKHETSLTRGQRVEVERLIDGWFARDAAVRA
ncbi:MAG: hypothetical protein HYT80_01005 [Euryarchaeota archaeon]|nr:hypothetical protein [Euryarchaeota archaeon]